MGRSEGAAGTSDAQSALRKLTEQEARLQRERERMEAEVMRLQKMVSEARTDLQEAEEASDRAGASVEDACSAMKVHVDPTAGDPLLADTTPLPQAPSSSVPAADPPAAEPESEGEPDSPAAGPAPAPLPPKVLCVTRSSPDEKLGLFFSNSTTEITRVYPGYAGEKAGLEPGWYIRKVRGTPIFSLPQLDDELRALSAELSFELTVSQSPPEARSPPKRAQRSVIVVSPDAAVEEVEEDEECEEDEAGAGQVDSDPDDGFVVVPSTDDVQTASATACTGTDPDTPLSPADRITNESYFSKETTPAASPEQSALQPEAGDSSTSQPSGTRAGHTTSTPESGASPTGTPGSTQVAGGAVVPRGGPQAPPATGAGCAPSDAGMKLPEIDLDSFKKFCEKYAQEHPEMMGPEAHEEPDEERMRMQEERRMRELREDPSAMRELLMRTIGIMEKQGDVQDPERNVVHTQPPAGLASCLSSDDWKRDYEHRVQAKESCKERWAVGTPTTPADVMPAPRLAPPAPAKPAAAAEAETEGTAEIVAVRTRRKVAIESEGGDGSGSDTEVAAAAVEPVSQTRDMRNMKPSDVIALVQSGVALTEISAEAAEKERLCRIEEDEARRQAAEDRKVQEWADKPCDIDTDSALRYLDDDRWK